MANSTGHIKCKTTPRGLQPIEAMLFVMGRSCDGHLFDILFDPENWYEIHRNLKIRPTATPFSGTLKIALLTPKFYPLVFFQYALD